MSEMIDGFTAQKIKDFWIDRRMNCTTTHYACDCQIKRMSELEIQLDQQRATIEKLEKQISDMTDEGCQLIRQFGARQKELEQANTELKIKMVNEYANAARLIEWIHSSDRKPANIAFSDGPERQVSYAIEVEIEKWWKPVASDGGTKNDPSQRPTEERLRAERVVAAAEGLMCGTGWNSGTLAKLHEYRQELIAAVKAYRASTGNEAKENEAKG